jgi:hypothetical protein
VLHVVPGEGGGSGTAADPFKGLNAAQDAAKPADIFLVHKGVYQGTFTIRKNGEPGRPIVWRAAGDGDAILDGGGAERTVSASGAKSIMFEGLTIRNGKWGIVAHGGSDVTCRRCHFMKIDSGFVAHSDGQKRIVVTDCLIEGPCVWPRSKGIEDPEGVEIQGEAVVVAWNRIHGFGDGISIFRGPSHAVDIYNNDISECTDDGIEMDYGGQNTRCLRNRLTNCFQGISFQPLFGGPCYAVRNVVYNLELEGYKLHNAPSGVLLYHNTTVRRGMDFVLWTGEKVTNMRARNNLFVGTTDKYALECIAPMIDADWDYDGYAGGPWNNFAKWNKKIYKTFDDFRQNSGIEKHAVEVSLKGLFASDIEPPADFRTQFDPKVNDLRLAPGSQAIEAGEVLPNINDAFKGKAPDLGALELDDGLPIYGPRPLKNHPN